MSSPSGWKTVTYGGQIRKSPTTGDGSPDGISTSTGIFTCAIKGAYKFEFAAEKVGFLLKCSKELGKYVVIPFSSFQYSGTYGEIKLLKNGSVQKYRHHSDTSSYRGLYLIAILELIPGDKVIFLVLLLF